ADVRDTPLAPRLSVTAPLVAVEIFVCSDVQVSPAATVMVCPLMVKVPAVGDRLSPALLNSVATDRSAALPRLAVLVADVAVARLATLTMKVPFIALALAVAVAVPGRLLVVALPIDELCR